MGSTSFFTLQELEVEQKFQDGMLSKMSKITDLVSRLEALEGGDARVMKSKAYNHNNFDKKEKSFVDT